MFDLEEFRRWDQQVDHGNDELVEAAIKEIERLHKQLQTARKFKARYSNIIEYIEGVSPALVEQAVEAVNAAQ